MHREGDPVNPGAICAALEAELATRTWWDEEPCLYALRAVGDGVELRPLELAEAWPDGDPVQVLTEIAADAAASSSATLAAVVTPDLAGFAFRAEVMYRGTEQRKIWAVTRDGGHFVALKIRGVDVMTSGRPESAPGPVRTALEWLVQTAATAVN